MICNMVYKTQTVVSRLYNALRIQSMWHPGYATCYGFSQRDEEEKWGNVSSFVDKHLTTIDAIIK